MITICCTADRRWQTSIFGYGGQTHSLADLVVDPIHREIRAFCNCRITMISIDEEKKYRVQEFGQAFITRIDRNGCCKYCGHAVFYSSRYYKPKLPKYQKNWVKLPEEVADGTIY